MMDAITRCNMQLDNITYRKVSRRWRHYLPASFADAVIGGSRNIDGERMRVHFTGNQIGYEVPNCRMIIAPVCYLGKWSCYYWDFMNKKIILLDPMKMNMNPATVELTTIGWYLL
ncbi:hypothetical protein GQ55_5G293000 [Panicum hallii var. hallii]|uniref:Uncharacterized protein n=1 Tax=Panicum hallii var. hallii TaxID=1504633 RepID=A0A2T7DLB8_9POAL|nr:hypothetical protein GQ55_5G293000 [Panicum hallii var. hallii]